MKSLLIFGVDTIAGSNIAATLCDHYQVIGVSLSATPDLPGCQLLSGAAAVKQPESLLANLQPSYVIDASCCGDSPWNPAAELGQADQCEISLRLAVACHQAEIPLVFLSSDAVLTGPWMFHEEDSSDYCSSVIGQRLLNLEQQIQIQTPGSLILRTHIFGWSPFTENEQTGWLESLWGRIAERKNCPELHLPGHACPLLATELAVIIDRAIQENLTGLFHVAGAERVNRLQFVRRFAEYFAQTHFRFPLQLSHFSQAERKSFGCGESSLQTRSIRKQLCLAMPTLGESMAQLKIQQENGYFQSIPATRQLLTKAA